LVMWPMIIHFPPPGRKKFEERWVWGEGGGLSWMGFQTSLWLHVNGGMLHCPRQSHMSSCFLPAVLFLLLAPVVGGGHLNTEEGAQCCRDQSGISTGPNQHSRLKHTLCYLLLSDPARQQWSFSLWRFLLANVLLPG
jgi:hypothetical protein